MKIALDKEIFVKYPQLKVGFIYAWGIDNRTNLKESIHLLRDVEDAVRLSFHKETVKNHYLISPWAVAQEEFGKEAKHYQTSVEKVLQKVLQRKKIAVTNVVTNILNYIALKHIIPIGVDDTAEVQGDLTFSVATGKEKKGVLQKLKQGELYYHDEKGILGTKLDYWKNTRTKLIPTSVFGLVHLEALPPLTPKKIQAILKETTNLIQSFCGGKTKALILDKNKPTGRF